VKTFRQLHGPLPPELAPECGRLYFEYLVPAAREAAGGKSPLNGLERADAPAAVLAWLGAPAVAATNVDNGCTPRRK